MSYVLMRNVNKNFKEHKQAIQEMFDLFPNGLFQVGCNSYNGRYYQNFEVNVSVEEFAPIATDFYLLVDNLFDFSTPRIIKKNYRTWNEYVKVTLKWRKSCNFYTTDFWEKGKPRIHKIATSIYLESQCKYYGLFQWEKNYSKLMKLLNKNSDKKLKERFKKLVQKANEKVDEWQKAMAEAHQESLKI